MASERRKKRRKLVRAMRDGIERLNAAKTDPAPIVAALLEGVVFYLELREGIEKEKQR
jgi:hypothetical protein